MTTNKLNKDIAIKYFSRLFKGKHHIPSEVRAYKDYTDAWYVTHFMNMSTYDGDTLTRAVFLAHDMCVRLDIKPASPMYIKLVISKRDREGLIYDKHPTLGEALRVWRENNAEEESSND